MQCKLYIMDISWKTPRLACLHTYHRVLSEMPYPSLWKLMPKKPEYWKDGTLQKHCTSYCAPRIPWLPGGHRCALIAFYDSSANDLGNFCNILPILYTLKGKGMIAGTGMAPWSVYVEWKIAYKQLWLNNRDHWSSCASSGNQPALSVNRVRQESIQTFHSLRWKCWLDCQFDICVT